MQLWQICRKWFWLNNTQKTNGNNSGKRNWASKVISTFRSKPSKSTFAPTFERYQAIPYFEKVIKKNPLDADAHCGLGGAYVGLGRYQEAVEAFKEAIRLKSDYADAHYNLGVVYLYLGDKGSALEEYKILKDLNQEEANRLFNSIYK